MVSEKRDALLHIKLPHGLIKEFSKRKIYFYNFRNKGVLVFFDFLILSLTSELHLSFVPFSKCVSSSFLRNSNLALFYMRCFFQRVKSGWTFQNHLSIMGHYTIQALIRRPGTVLQWQALWVCGTLLTKYGGKIDLANWKQISSVPNSIIGGKLSSTQIGFLSPEC